MNDQFPSLADLIGVEERRSGPQDLALQATHTAWIGVLRAELTHARELAEQHAALLTAAKDAKILIVTGFVNAAGLRLENAIAACEDKPAAPEK